MRRRGKSSKPKVMTGTAFTRLPLPSGVPVPMCFYGDPCEVAKSDEEESCNQRYWCVKIMHSILLLVRFTLRC
jgi:hypothetical protein